MTDTVAFLAGSTGQSGAVWVSAANPLPIVPSAGAGGQVTPTAGTTSTVATGGTAVTVATGVIHGGYVTNPINAAGQGIAAAENAYLDMVASPGSTDGAGNGTTVILQPGQTFTLPPLTTGIAVKVNAATSGHKLTVVIW